MIRIGFYPAHLSIFFVFAVVTRIDFYFLMGSIFGLANFFSITRHLGLRLLFLVDHLLHLDGCVQFSPDLSQCISIAKGCPWLFIRQ